MTYSLDFRKKVLSVRESESLTFAEVASRFCVGVASVVRWSRRIDSKKHRNKPPISVNIDLLKEDVVLYPDAYYYERAQRLGVSTSGIWFALKRLGYTYKKNLKSSKSKRRSTLLFPEKDRHIPEK